MLTPRFLSKGALMLMALCSATALADSPRYIFYFIGDGMGMAPVMASVTYRRNVLHNDTLPLMMRFPNAGQVMTFSASSDVTDSAAAGTALATGHKTRNSMLGMDADSVPVNSIAYELKEQKGYGVGIVTNVGADDATPGAFYAHVPRRWEAEPIDRQFIDSKVDFLAGSGLNGLYDKEGKSTGVLELMAERNITLTHCPDSAAAAQGRVVLLQHNPFQTGNTGYLIDRIDGTLTLPQMARACLTNLETKYPDGFFMMVEGGNIDHALHGNDAMTAISEIYNFNNALQVAYDFLQAHTDETLIVVTADHDTGGLSVGCKSTGYKAVFDVLSHQKMSKEMLSDLCTQWVKSGNLMTWEQMQAFLKENFGFWDTVALKEADTQRLADLYAKILSGERVEGEKGLYNDFDAFAGTVFNIISDKAGAGFTTGAHTGNPVPVYAAGVGSEAFGRVMNNIEIPAAIRRIAGIK